MHKSASAVRSLPGFHRLVAATFTIAIFVNAALLFAVQPMFSKMALPLLGGTPAVWNTCMLFFQAALLGGYLYAHVASTRLTARGQIMTHLGLLTLAAATLPIAIGPRFQVPSTTAPVAWLIGLLAVSLGAPFFVLAAGSPLLQHWFSRTGHPAAHNPYFLYAASNLGSMVALLAYPTVLEPVLPLGAQGRGWSAVYAALIGLVGACAYLATRGAPAAKGASAPSGLAATEPATMAAETEPLTVGRRLRWVFLAFVPSSLLLGATTYLSTDVAPIPLLWIVPLAIYLLTFVLAFSNRVWFRPKLVLALQAVFLVWLAMTMSTGLSGLVTVMGPAHVAGLFLSAMVCHGALAQDRPSVGHLTAFYLWISLGGVLGGLFNVLIAPAIFNSLAEYPIAIVLAAAARPLLSAPRAKPSHWLDVALPLVLGGGVFLLTRQGLPVPGLSFRASLAAVAACALACLAFQRRPIRFALGLAALFIGVGLGLGRGEQLLYRTRSFFAVHKVVRYDHIHALQHGTTIHGAQSLDSAESLEPMTYFHRRSPIAQVFSSLLQDRPSRRVAIAGLGTGTMACYGRSNESWTFFEIDPVVERIARDPEYFTYLRDCPPEKKVVIGDARVSLRQVPDSQFDLIIMDAFTSDAVPVHLLTRDALELYLTKLAPGGVVVFHISNRYLELEPVVAGVGRSLGLPVLAGSDSHLTPEDRGPYRSLSRWVVVARSAADLAPLRALPGWYDPPRVTERPWTDDFSNVLGAFRRRQ